ncbi:hypothetical protein JXJ21_06300 [candidate division KSB1 bacterium]|nr:hypothetical protein [candidate division KSB1 bacterium]
MCCKNSKTVCCQNPVELKEDVQNCTKEQILKCHGNVKKHPCTHHKKENKE